MSTADNTGLFRQRTEARLHEIAGRADGVLGLSVLDLTSGERFGINQDNLFPQASAIKIPVLMEVYRQAAQGNFKLSDIRRIQKQHMAAGSGILNELGDGTVQLSIYDLCVLMILLSDNTATNTLIDLVGMSAINGTMTSLGLKQTRLQRRMMDTEASVRGNDNLSTPAEAARVMEILWRGEFINRAVCDEILAILKKPKPSPIISGLPTETLVAFKPGGLPGVMTAWAIVLLKERPYVFTIMESHGAAQTSPETFTDISRVLYHHFHRLSMANPFGSYLVSTSREPA